MEQKKKEYATPNMKEFKLNAQVALLDTSNKDEVGFAPMPCDTEHLA